ncbi:MAG TPA: FISUMP domain-containing protein [Saprospiraceae bacterium]|nr:FISUMP domain-containing protein [Saprospiraceae bacterium]
MVLIKQFSFFSFLFILVISTTVVFSQNVGVGITTPIAKLHIKGSANIPQFIIDANSTQSNLLPLIKLRNSLGNDLLWIHSDDTSNTFIGLRAGKSNNAASSGWYNTFIGGDAGYANTSGQFNTANGNHALFSNTTGSNNTANGSAALFSNTTGANNTAVGYFSLGSNTTGDNNTTSGFGSLFSNTTGTNNIAFGYESLYLNSTGANNTVYGTSAMWSNTSGFSNVAIGMRALNLNTARSNLVAIGDSALYTNGQGASEIFHATNNTAIGSKSLYANTIGHSNTAVGYNSLKANTTGGHNTAVGMSVMLLNTTGSANVALGSNALRSNTIGGFNTGLGFSALSMNTIGTSSTAVGYNSMLFNTTGSNNTAHGFESLRSNTTGKNNTAIGYRALYKNTTGINNIAIGDSALLTITIGNNNTAIGHGANVSLADISNASAIGSKAFAGVSNSVVIGSITGVNGATANANVGIGTSAPNARLHINGTLRIENGTQGEGKILTSDATGFASWQPPSSPPPVYYASVGICCQSWMTKNLDVTTYRNGDPIPKVTTNSAWAVLTTGAYCYYNNDSTTYAATYGKLYNWYAVNDPRGLAPEGWHIPTDFEWTTLGNCLGGNSIAGGLMKEAGTVHWTSPNTGATNLSGFTGLPAGFRDNSGFFNAISTTGVWWSSIGLNASSAIWRM